MKALIPSASFENRFLPEQSPAKGNIMRLTNL